MSDRRDVHQPVPNAGHKLTRNIVLVSGAAVMGTSLVTPPPLFYVLAVLVLGFGTHRIVRRITGESASTWLFLLSMIVLADGVAQHVLWGYHRGGTFAWWQAKATIVFAYFLPLYLFPHVKASAHSASVPDQ